MKQIQVRSRKVLPHPGYEVVLWGYRLVWAAGALAVYVAVAGILLLGVGLPWWVVAVHMMLSHPGLRALTITAADLLERDFHRRFQSISDWFDEFHA